MRKALGILALALSMTLVSCGDAAGPDSLERVRADLRRERERWESRGIDDYVLTVRRLCECVPESTRPVAVRVRAGAVASRTYVDTGEPVAAADAHLFPSVGGLFEAIEEGIEREAELIEVEYDPAGFPRRVLVDLLRQVADEEVILEVQEFVSEEDVPSGGAAS